MWSFTLLDKVKKNREIYFPSRDHRTSAETHLITVNKFDFVLQIIESDPFNTSKFGWIDCFLSTSEKKCRISEDYSIEKFINILNDITDKFHIQILNVCDKKYKLDENKREYYSRYQHVVCGGFFTCGKEIGIRILNRLKDVVVRTIELGYGHGEEMCFLEILDEFADHIERGYGDYGQIFDNIIKPTRNYHYITHTILKKYVDMCYYKEAHDCSTKLLSQIESNKVNVEPNTYLDILFLHYLIIYYYKKHETVDFVTHIRDVCNKNLNMKNAYNKKKDYYNNQFDYVKYLRPTHDIVICIFACATVDKYKKEILKINETWGYLAESKNIKVLYFLGEEPTDLKDNKFIYLKDVKNDYLSANDKQNLGLKYICDNYNVKFIYSCGTDTYINVEKLLLYVKDLDENKRLYIGGHGDYRLIGNKKIYFHSGGSGFILSKCSLHYLYPKLYNMTYDWQNICLNESITNLQTGCDIAISYYLQVNNFIIEDDIVKENDKFYACNYLGYCHNNTYNCCSQKIDIKKIIACHHMTLTDFDQFTQILRDNNYFISNV